MMVLYGALALIGQAVLLHEIGALFGGDEIALAVLLFSWLIGNGVGAAIYRVLPARIRAEDGLEDHLLCAMSLLIVAMVFAVRFAFGCFQYHAQPNLVYVSVLSFILILPSSVLTGLAFTRMAVVRVPSRALGQAYFLESLGAFAGGVALTFMLARERGSLGVALVASAACLPLFITRGALARGPRVAAALAIGTVCAVFCGPAMEKVSVLSRKIQFRHAQLLASRDTRFGNVSLVRSGDTETTYYNGRVLFSSDQDAFEEEALVPALVSARPRHVLVAGPCPHPLLRQLLRMKPALVRIVFPDTALLPSRSPAPQEKRRRGPPTRILTSVLDPFRADSIPRPVEGYDLVLVRAGLPLSIADNRFYSVEFYQRLKKLLSPGGMVSFSLPYAEDHPEPLTVSRLSMIRDTLGTSFTQVTFLPARKFHFFASDMPLTVNEGVATRRLKDLRSGGNFVNRGFVRHYFRAGRIVWFSGLMRQDSGRRDKTIFGRRPSPEDGTTRANRVFDMGMYRHGLVYRLRSDLREAAVVSVIALAAGLALLIRRLRRIAAFFRADRRSAYMFFVGFCVMTAEIQLLQFFQGSSGQMYFAYALLAGVFMLGTSVGAGCVYTLHPTGRMAAVVLPGSLIAWPGVVGWLFLARPESYAVPFGVNLIGGIALGAVFSFEAGRVRAASAGVEAAVSRLYSFDLFGAAAAALAAPLLLIPLLGHPWCAVVNALALTGASALTWRRSRGR